MQIGVPRASAQTASAQELAEQLQWRRAPDGTWRTALRMRSGGAFGVRLGLEIEQLPPAAVLRLYAPGQREKADETLGQHVLHLLQANLESGDTSANGRTWWAPDSGSEEAVLEIDLPPDANPGMLRFSIPQVSHIYLDTSRLLAPLGGKDVGDSMNCANSNVECSASPAKQAAANAVARMRFSSGGSSYYCTGTLLSNTGGSNTPYFLTANHCISTQAEAGSLQTDWFFQSATCGGTTLSGSQVALGGGAQLLHTRAENDSTLLQLNSTPPTGAMFAAWTANSVANAQSMAGIHHPAGDLKKISVGAVSGFLNCIPGTTTCSTTSQASSNRIHVQWSGSGTEGGSSGSPLLTNAGEVVGVLHGGEPNVCSGGAKDFYGRFDQFYPHVSQWLNPVTAAFTITADGPTAASPVAADAGGNVSVAVQVQNTGMAQMTGITYQSSGIPVAAVGCTYITSGGPGVCSVAASGIISSLPSTLAANASVTYTLTYTVPDPTAAHQINHAFTATGGLTVGGISHIASHGAVGSFGITAPGNNSSTPHPPDPASGLVTVAVQVQNTSTVPMTGVTYQSSGIPVAAVGCTYTTSGGGGTGNCTVASTGAVTGLPAALAASASVTYTLTYTVPNPTAAHQIAHQFGAAGGISDTETSYIAGYSKSFAVSADGSGGPGVAPTAGGHVSVNVTVQNGGVTPMAGITYQSSGIPATATAVSCTSTAGACTINTATGAITGLPATLAPGASVTYTLTYTVPDPTAAHTLSHTFAATGVPNGAAISGVQPFASRATGGGVQSVPATGALALGGTAALMALLPGVAVYRRRKAAANTAALRDAA